MNQDFQSQIDRAKELLKELEEVCNDDLKTQNVSGKTKNLSQEVLTKIRHTLDRSMYKFFEEKYASLFPMVKNGRFVFLGCNHTSYQIGRSVLILPLLVPCTKSYEVGGFLSHETVE